MSGSSPAELPVILRSVPFSTTKALELGVPRARLRAQDLARPFFGVRTSRPPAGLLERAQAYAEWMGGDRFFSHATAAAVWGLPLPSSLADGPLDVTTPGIARSARSAGVVGHRTRRPTKVVTVAGLRVTDPIRTFLDLAGILTFDGLVAVGDAVVRQPFTRRDRPALASLDDLVGATEHNRGIPGAGSARRAAVLVRVGSASPSETFLRLGMHRRGLPEPELNGKVFGADRQYLGRPDFVFRHQRVLVEYEGDHHRIDPATFRYDIRRRERFEDEGWRVVRATADDLGRTSRAFLDRLSWLLANRVHE